MDSGANFILEASGCATLFGAEGGAVKKFFLAAMAVTMMAVLGLAAVSAAAKPGLASLSAERLRCEYRDNPAAVDARWPRLSWIVTGTGRGLRQNAYRILAASSREKLDADQGDLWDTGRVESDETVLVPWAGAPLKPRSQVFWKVMVWDQDGNQSPWCEPAFFGLGHPAAAWKAEWIGYDVPLDLGRRMIWDASPELTAVLPMIWDASPALAAVLPKTKTYRPSPYLRREFTAGKPVRRATVYASALGLFELWLNGERVGKDYFTPGFTDYNKRLYYLAYDVTPLVKQGRNGFGAILSDGWYAGNIFNRGQKWFGSKLRLRAELFIEYADGTSELIQTDGSWRGGEGPIREADIQAGEAYDARREADFSRPGFDDKKWHAVDLGAEILPTVFEAYPGIPVHKTQEIKPVAITEPKPGVFIYDLAQNFAGWARLKVSGQAGERVKLRFGEMLNPDGTLYTTNLRSARVTDFYTLKGGGEEVWEPRFTFHGFRYIEVTGYPGKPGMDAITGVVAHSDLPETGIFESPDTSLNRLYQNIVWGQRSNYFDIPTDCPQRDERMGWMGDAQVFVHTATYNMDIGAFFTKWMRDVVDAQLPSGAFSDISPNRSRGLVGTQAAAGWADAGVICPYNIWKAYGDTGIIDASWPAMVRYIDFLESRSPNGLSPRLGTYGDWLNVSSPTPLDLIATAYFGYSTRLMAEMARATGRTAEADRYDRLFKQISAAFTREFVTADGRTKPDTQASYLLALRFGLLPAELRPAAGANLVKAIEARDGCLSTGFLGVNFLLPTLTDIGRNDWAWKLLLNHRYPSWLYSVDQGATTMWERWNSYTIESGFGNPSMNSFNHYAYGSAGEWMFGTAAGIAEETPGYKRILIRPTPGGGFEFLRASYDSIRGPIKTEWRVKDDAFSLDVTIPANTTATVFIPAADPAKVTEGGQPVAKAAGVKFLRAEPGAAVYEVGSGTYSFAAKSGE